MKKMILAAAMLLFCSTGAFAQKLVVLHTNDTHSHLDPERNGEGGVIERAAFVDSVRRAEGAKHVLLLHAGDWNQGTSYFTVLNGDLEVSLLNALKYDCVCLGNHEFDNGIEDLTRRAKAMNMPIVCANYDFSSFELGKYVKPYTIIKKGKVKIGIVGALCDITTVVARPIADRIPKLETIPAIRKYAKFLKEEEQCDYVILLSHAGYGGDTRIAEEVEGIDLIVGGHSHTFLKQMDTSHAGTDGKPIPIVQDGSWGREMGVVKFY